MWYGNNPFSAYLADVTDRHGDLYFPGGGGVEDVWRLLKGYDVRGGNNLRNEHWPGSISGRYRDLGRCILPVPVVSTGRAARCRTIQRIGHVRRCHRRER